jgi:hypothetical protein
MKQEDIIQTNGKAIIETEKLPTIRWLEEDIRGLEF